MLSMSEKGCKISRKFGAMRKKILHFSVEEKIQKFGGKLKYVQYILFQFPVKPKQDKLHYYLAYKVVLPGIFMKFKYSVLLRGI